MSLASIASGLIKPLTDLYGNRQKRKADESAAKATVERIFAEAGAADAAVAGQIALVNVQNQNNTWKDEYALITITAPYWVSFIIALAATIGPFDYDATVVIEAMFTPMAAIPAYWQDTFQVAIWTALGITSLKKVLN